MHTTHTGRVTAHPTPVPTNSRAQMPTTDVGAPDQWSRARSARAFSLIEVMIVIAIIVALMAIVGLNVFGRREQATVQLTQVDLKNLEQALKGFRLDFARFPSEEEGLAVLWDKELLDTEADPAQWSGPYLDEPMPRDRWNTEWYYEPLEADDEQGPYLLYSFGPNAEDDDRQEDDVTPPRRDTGSEDGTDASGFEPSSAGSGSGG